MRLLGRRMVMGKQVPLELEVDPTVVKKEGANVTITNGIASKLINANSNSSNRGYWQSFTNGKSWIYDVTSEVGKTIKITYWNRANSRTYIFVPDIALIPSSDPGAEDWPNLYIKLGSKATSTTTYTAKTATTTVPNPVTVAGNNCEKVYLIVSGYYVSADSDSNIIPKVERVS